MPRDAVRVRLNVEETGGAMPVAKRVAQNFDVGLRAFWRERVRIAKPQNQVLQVARPGLWIRRAHLRKRKIGEDVGVAIQRLVIDAFQIIVRVEEKTSEDDVSEPLDRPRELLVPVILFRQS